ncbi:type VII secretion target [Mycolicibacterium sp.]|uniref:type VII secretion target n=1 Tax=Mycolicibacterium sp. TaxID=2320850 RepID=UPI0037C9E6B3
MGLLDTSCVGLNQLAMDCRSLGVAIAAGTDYAPSGLTWQATVAAVNNANADAAVAARVMEARMHDTAASLRTAAAHYESNEHQSASDLRALVAEV